MDLATPFYNFNRDGVAVSQGLRDSFQRLGLQAGIKGAYDCIREFSETDFTADLKAIDVPTLVAHGDDDQIVPIAASAQLTAKLVPDATLKIYPGGSHGLAQSTPDAFNADLLAFIQG
jgi:non-heme chloroperoxidase